MGSIPKLELAVVTSQVLL